MTVWVFVLCSLAAWRAALLLTTDEITDPLRTRVGRRWPPTLAGPSWPSRLAACPRCVSIWTSAAAVGFARLSGIAWSWPETALAWWAAAAVCVLLGRVTR